MQLCAVQTLPILNFFQCLWIPFPAIFLILKTCVSVLHPLICKYQKSRQYLLSSPCQIFACSLAPPLSLFCPPLQNCSIPRSEERRVGEEGRSRWARGH